VSARVRSYVRAARSPPVSSNCGAQKLFRLGSLPTMIRVKEGNFSATAAANWVNSVRCSSFWGV
jgi:hypothetical protein